MLFRSRGRESQARVKPQPTTLEPHANRTLPTSVIIWGPEYDEATQIIGSWLDEIPVPKGMSKHSAIGKDINKDDFNQILDETEGTNRIKIFGGHGSPDALLGPVYENCARTVIDGNEFAVLYDETSIRDGSAALFAFCCKAGGKLGIRFAESGERTFLGYDGNIGYDLDNEECQKVWGTIIQIVSREIIKDGEIAKKHEDLLRKLYDEALEYFRDGQGKENDRALETVILLMQHKKFLRRIGGSS